jgi:lysophospholipase L1-like esterase
MVSIEWKRNQKILFIGDSITDAERRERPYAPLGQGYVHYAANFLVARHPELDLVIENRGISGDTTREMKARWQKDCLALRPDVLSVMIGINDLWRNFKPIKEAHKTHVPTEEYEGNLRWMLGEAVRRCGSRLILMEPFYFCSDPADQMYGDLRAYLEVVHALAAEFGAVLVPLQQAYEKIKDRVPEKRWADDRVHPYPWAHAWIAQQWLSAIDGA